MRIPKTPPDYGPFLAALFKRSDRLDAIARRPGPLHEGRYLHWDKLRHYQAPEGLSHEEWWALLKLARQLLRRETPLKDISGKSFGFALPDPVLEKLLRIDQNAAGRIEIADPRIANPSTRDRYLVHSLIEEAITSSQLEGAATTRRVAKQMIRSRRTPRDRSERMILNNYLAMQRIRQLKERPLTTQLLLELHRILATDTLDDPSHVGRFRRADETVRVADPYNQVLHTPPPADELSARLSLMCDFANGESPDYFIHPVIRAILLHFWLAYEHPFVDGNGRCARALFYWSMLREGHWLCEFISISQIIRKAPSQYGRAFLYTETDENDLTYFILYHLDIVERAIREIHKYIAAKEKAVRATERLARASARFNHRQLALLSHALRNPDAEYTFTSHAVSHGVVYQTARTDLLELVDRGLLVSRKDGRTYVFSPPPDLDRSLRNAE